MQSRGRPLDAQPCCGKHLLTSRKDRRHVSATQVENEFEIALGQGMTYFAVGSVVTLVFEDNYRRDVMRPGTPRPRTPCQIGIPVAHFTQVPSGDTNDLGFKTVSI